MNGCVGFVEKICEYHLCRLGSILTHVLKPCNLMKLLECFPVYYQVWCFLYIIRYDVFLHIIKYDDFLHIIRYDVFPVREFIP